MNIKSILFVLILIALFFDGTLFSIPVVFSLSVLSYVLFPEDITIFALFFAGITLDILKVQTIGLTSIFMLITFLLIYLWRQTAEIKDYKVVAAIVFLATYIYAIFFHYSTNLIIYLLIFGIITGVVSYFSKSKLLFW